MIGSKNLGLRQSASCWRRLDRRGSVTLMMAGATIPMIIAVGVGVDVARLAMAQVAMQAAVDGAALAGATVYSDSNASNKAKVVGQTYFDHYTEGSLVSGVTRIATATQGTLSSGQTAFKVDVSATGQMPTTFMQVAGFSSMTVRAHAVAANPYLQPNPVQPSNGSVALGKNTTDAWDWNTAYMYPIPMDANGTVHYDQLPNRSQFFQIGNNCRSIDTTWSTQSPCNGRPGADWTQQVGNPPLYAPNQPVGFILVNQTGGVSPYSNNGKNQYGSPNDNYAVFETALFALGKSPSALADSDTSLDIVQKIFPPSPKPVQPVGVQTTYSKVTNNCSLIIQAYDPTTPVPQAPPTSGPCYSLDDASIGSQFATLSCAQMNGRTFIYWWNDMGGDTRDDRDYNDLSFQFSCKPAAAAPGTGPAPPGSTAISLVQ